MLDEVARRRLCEPLLLHKFGNFEDPDGHGRRRLFASTLRGTGVCAGGNRANKTNVVLLPFVVAMAEGYCDTLGMTYHAALCCPEDCPQYGQGSCGAHCCPQPKYGGADFSRADPPCVAPAAEYCPQHYPWGLDWPDTQTRLILIGCLSRQKFWSTIYGDGGKLGLKRLLCRDPQGRPLWDVDKETGRIIHKRGKYILQAMYYDEITRWESEDAIGVAFDEWPQEKFWDSARMRVLSSNGWIRIAGTARILLEGQGQWIKTRLKDRSRIVSAGVQCMSIKTIDNAFLDEASVRRAEIERADLLAQGKEQMARVVFDGEIELRQDSCYFTRTCIDRQSQKLVRGATRWVSVPDDDPRNTALPPFFVEKAPNEALPRYALEVWEKAILGRRFAMGVDIAEGLTQDGGDYSAIEGCDADTGMQAFEYHGHCETPRLAAIIYALIQEYKDFGYGGICIERNGPGKDVLRRLIHEYGVPATMFYFNTQAPDRMLNGEMLPAGAGFNMTGTSKRSQELETPYGTIASPLEALQSDCSRGHITLRSAQCVAEMSVFIKYNRMLEAIKGCNDDRVIALSLMAFVRQLIIRVPREDYLAERKPRPAVGIGTAHLKSRRHHCDPSAADVLENVNQWVDEPWNIARGA